MKNVRTTNRDIRFIPALILLLAIVVGFSACKKDNNDTVNTPATGLMAFNLAPGQNAVLFGISGNSLTSQPLAFSSFTGTYINIYTGNRVVEARNAGTGALLDSSLQTFEAGKYYSTFLIGSDSNYQNIVVKDDIDTLTAGTGQAYIRYINAIPDASSPDVNITANGSNIFTTPSPFGTISAFKEVPAGTVSIAVGNESTINSSRTIAVTSKKIYTVLLIGKPASTNPADSVQIRFIENGQIN